ncbi:flavodoxin domain-containing protein [Corynebacterium sp. S7]
MEHNQSSARTPLVVYRTHYGHAQSYAEWLAEDLGATLVNLGENSDPDLSTASVIILVCPIYARSYLGAKEFSVLVENSPEIPLVGVSVSASDPQNPENIKAYKALVDVTFSEEIRSRMKWFHLRGGLDYPRMSRAHRAMMWMVSRAAKRKGAKGDAESQMMYESYGQVIDFRDRATIAPVVEYVRGLN